MRGPVSLALSLVVPMLLAGQAPAGVAEHIARGDSAHAALAPPQALEQYRAALAVDSTNYAALWKAGRELVDIAKRSEEHTSELQSQSNLVCRLLLETKKRET